MKKILRLILTLALFGGYMQDAGSAVYDVRTFGAKGDGQAIDSPAINVALQKAAEKGDTVLLSGGTFLSYSLHLQSGVTLRIEKDAVLKAAPATDTQGYDEAEPNDFDQYQDFGHSHFHNSLLWGEGLHDVTIEGSGFRHITIRRCTFTHCRGLALETVDGAEMSNINVSDLTMTDICNSPIYIRLGDRMRAPKGFHPSKVSDIRIKNIQVTNADSRYACLIAGIEDHPIRNVHIENVSIEYRGGLTLQDVKEQRGSNPFFYKPKRNTDRFGMKAYPEPAAHGIQPAWGFSISYAENIVLKNIRMTLLQPDERPPFYLDHTQNIQLPDSPFAQ